MKDAGQPPSIFDERSISDIYDEVRRIYRADSRPWVIGYSGGKDSTLATQIIWNALAALPEGDRAKPVYVIASNTMVENPAIVGHVSGTLRLIADAATKGKMQFRAHLVMPSLDDSFWVNLIGRGYAAPTVRYRWCTDRLKIKPANRFILERIAEYGEVVVVLGVREGESAARGQLMATYAIEGTELRRHSSLPRAHVYAPIARFSTDDVWSYLLQVPSPWGADNHQRLALYRQAAGGECPLVIDTSTPSCGQSRFGCWVCTVARRDTTMESLVDNGEEWLEPLLELRDFLAETTDPERKREYRGIRGRRDGRVSLKKDGLAAARGYTLDASKAILRRVLEAQSRVRADERGADVTLIRDEELHEIRRIWREERHDWDDSVPLMYREVFGVDLPWVSVRPYSFTSEDRQLLERIASIYGVPFELLAGLHEATDAFALTTDRPNVLRVIGKILGEEWRTEEEIVGAARDLPAEPRQQRLL